MKHHAVPDELLKNLNQQHIVLFFRGSITNEIIQHFIKIMDILLSERGISKLYRKRMIMTMIESLQNVIHYNNHLQQKAIDVGNKSIFLIQETTEQCLMLLVANQVHGKDRGALQARLEAIRNYPFEKLHEQQLDILASKSVGQIHSGSEGAGLGLIEMARKCNGKFDYHFYEFDNEFDYFTIRFHFQVS